MTNAEIEAAADADLAQAAPESDEAAAKPSAKAVAKALAAADAAASATDGGPAATDADADTEPRPRLAVAADARRHADDHVAEAGRKVLRFHLARMLAKEQGTRDGNDPEDLHAMRVATRRQRAAWRVFGDAFRGGRTKTYRRGLREIASRLGAVRDLDVLLEAADAYRADLPTTEQRALEPLLAGWRLHREDARRLLVRELDSDELPAMGRRLRRVRAPRGPRGRAGRADAAAPRPRHRRLADPDRVRGRPGLRAGPALGRRRDAPRAADRRQVAALHARVHPGGPAAGSGDADRPRHRAPGPPRAAERRERDREHGPLVPRRERRRR